MNHQGPDKDNSWPGKKLAISTNLLKYISIFQYRCLIGDKTPKLQFVATKT